MENILLLGVLTENMLTLNCPAGLDVHLCFQALPLTLTTNKRNPQSLSLIKNVVLALYNLLLHIGQHLNLDFSHSNKLVN